MPVPANKSMKGRTEAAADLLLEAMTECSGGDTGDAHVRLRGLGISTRFAAQTTPPQAPLSHPYIGALDQ
jgi:hypothetical protein